MSSLHEEGGCSGQVCKALWSWPRVEDEHGSRDMTMREAVVLVIAEILADRDKDRFRLILAALAEKADMYSEGILLAHPKGSWYRCYDGTLGWSVEPWVNNGHGIHMPIAAGWWCDAFDEGKIAERLAMRPFHRPYISREMVPGA
jgi:hypothetical protein